MLKATQGTLIACQLAHRYKWSINLSGGYHHASLQCGGGFCIYPDITLAVHYIRTRLFLQKIMIIDLDAHQGNGHQADFIDDNKVFIVDCYNQNIYPGDGYAKQGIRLQLNIIDQNIEDDEYLKNLYQIEEKIEQFKPQFIVYNAGTDVLDGDMLGRMRLTENCIRDRDQYVVRLALQNHIPIVMLLSGGYQMNNSRVIADSIYNLIQKFDQ